MGDELIALGGAFLAAGLLARVGRRVGLPTIPFFIAAGILTGPHTPGPALVEDPHVLELFAAVGLVLLLFHLGLEFSLGDLAAGGKSLARAGAVYLLLNAGGGLLFGLSLGWGVREAFVIAGAVGISSSAIATKLLVELKRLANPETGLILGIIVVEDVFLALYLAVLQPILQPSGGLGQALVLFARAFGFLVALVAVARFGAGWVGRLVHSNDDELLTVLFVGLAIFVAGLAEELGVSDAIGAFLAGMILAETNLKHRVEKLVLPLRDAFAAVFFFAFGLTINPGDARTVGGPVAAAVVLSIVANVLAGSLAARSYRFGRREAANIGLTVLGRGELSLILATLATAAGLDSRIPPFVALYVLALALLGPLFASRSDVLAAWLPARLFRAGPSPVPRPQLREDSVIATRLASSRAASDRSGARWADAARKWPRTSWKTVKGGLRILSRRRRMEERMERLHDHYIVCAYGRVGRAAARELEGEGVPVVAIDTQQDLEAQMQDDGVLYIIGDPTSEPVLRRAGIERARGLVCAVDSDATNVFVTLTARSLSPDIYIVARASSPETPDRLYRAGANRVISPYRSSGRQMALLVMRPRVVDSLEVLGRRLEELEVEEGSHLIGVPVVEACDPAVPLLVHRATGETLPNPGPDVTLRVGDRILAWGADADLKPVESD